MSDMESQRTGYLPIIFSDDFKSAELGNLPLIQSIDKSVKKLTDEFYEFKRETNNRFEVIEKDIAFLKKETSELRTDVNMLKTEVRAISVRLDGMDKRFDSIDKRIDDMNQSQNKYFTLLGIMVAVIPIAVAIIQSFLTK
ncbi:MAG: hypothetical protein IJQ47_02575 [Synergistaceae bacterium]|nr:hypothetical protein [Synergistaceae bacterium]